MLQVIGFVDEIDDGCRIDLQYQKSKNKSKTVKKKFFFSSAETKKKKK